MSRHQEEPVYYREIQKNAYLKRIPAEPTKLRPLSQKKSMPKAMWTMFCVHNGKTPYLEQYPEPESPCTLAHRPTWRASLMTARHVTASVMPWCGGEFDFLVATDEGPVRMLAPDWDSMQEWVRTLREKLFELRVVGRGENVYCAPPAPPPPRAPLRDPTSPLPPTPPTPAIRVPGIEIVPTRTTTPSQIVQDSAHVESAGSSSSERPLDPAPESAAEPSREASQPSSSHTPAPARTDKTKSKHVARICGQNICLNGALFEREQNYTDEDFFSALDEVRKSEVDQQTAAEPSSTEQEGSPNKYNIEVRDAEAPYVQMSEVVVNEAETRSGEVAGRGDVFKQRVVISGAPNALCDPTTSHRIPVSEDESGSQVSNVTVIKVSNPRGPPHTAIPVLGSHVDVFDFDMKPGATSEHSTADKPGDFVNIVNTEVSVETNGYGTIFSSGNSDAAIFPNNATTNGLKEVSNEATPNGVRMDVHAQAHPGSSADSPYGYLSMTTTLKVTSKDDNVYEKLCMASTSNLGKVSPLAMRKFKENIDRMKQVKLDLNRKSSLPNLRADKATNSTQEDSTYEYLFPPGQEQRTDGRHQIQAAPRANKPETRAQNAKCSNANVALNSSIAEFNVSGGNGAELNVIVNVRGEGRAARGASRSPSGRVDVPAPLERAPPQPPASGAHPPKRDAKTGGDKGLFRRGLTELSFITKLRGLRRNEAKQNNEPDQRVGGKGVDAGGGRMSRSQQRELDSGRRRSTSLTTTGGCGGSAPEGGGGGGGLRWQQVAALVAEQARGAAVVAALPPRQLRRSPPTLFDAHNAVWVARWGVEGGAGARWGGRAGDRVAAVGGVRVQSAGHARRLLAAHDARSPALLHFHRVPLAHPLHLTRTHPNEHIGIKLDGGCGIVGVEAESPAARAGLPPPGHWALTEVNNRPLNLLKGGEEDMVRLSSKGLEVSVLIQPYSLVHKMRAALKAQHTILGIPSSRS